MNCAKTAEPIEMSFWGMDSDRSKEPYIRWGPNPQENGQFFWGGTGGLRGAPFSVMRPFVKILRPFACLPKTVTRQRRDCDLNPGPSAPESSTLTTRLPSHARSYT